MRRFTEYATENVRQLLDRLVDVKVSKEDYQDAMYRLGLDLAEKILDSLSPSDPVAEICIACTVEDADYLAKGIIDVMEAAERFKSVHLACFWNERLDPFGVKDAHIAPILKKYREPFLNVDHCYLIVVKSVIASACVVKTNLTNLIEESNPEKIMIAAPVILKDADEKLAKEFSDSIASRFQFWFYAVDDKRLDDGNLDPGIGGSVYERLGFSNGQAEKNQYVPLLVKARRTAIAKSYKTAIA